MRHLSFITEVSVKVQMEQEVGFVWPEVDVNSVYLSAFIINERENDTPRRDLLKHKVDI